MFGSALDSETWTIAVSRSIDKGFDEGIAGVGVEDEMDAGGHVVEEVDQLAAGTDREQQIRTAPNNEVGDLNGWCC